MRLSDSVRMIEVQPPLVEWKGRSRDYGDAAERQHDRGDQAI